MRILIVLLCLSLPALADQKKDLQAFLKRMTAFEGRISAIKRPPEKSPPSAFEPVETALTRAESEQGTLMKDMTAWGARNMGPGKIAPELGNAYNEMLRCLESQVRWMSARHTWAMAGSALDIKGLAARDAAAEKEYRVARDAVGTLLK